MSRSRPRALLLTVGVRRRTRLSRSQIAGVGAARRVDSKVRPRAGERGACMGEPLTSVCVFNQVVEENSYWLCADIKENGDLNIYGK